MIILGEILALFASLIWTVSSLSAEVSSKRIGSLSLNIFSITLAFICLNITLLCFTGLPIPQYLNAEAVYWIVASGVLGYLFCNYFLFSSYALIGSRFGQLFMTLTIPTAAFAGWILLDERLTFQEFIGMGVTFIGIAISILSGGGKKKDGDATTESKHKIGLKLPIKGIAFALIAAVAQGLALVLSKVGMIHYHHSVPEHLTKIDNFIPISAAYIRVGVGFLGFLLIILFTRKFQIIKKSMHDKKGFLTALLTGTAGPFVGATCSLFAMRYAKAGIAATLLELTPILIILPAALIFKQKVRFIEIIGAIISVFGVSLFFIKF